MKKNYLLIGGAAIAVWYFFLRKKGTTNKALVPVMPVQAAVIQPKPVGLPAGLSEGDYVKFGTDATVYLIHKGQKLPISEAWWNANAWDKWDTVKFVAPAVGLDIPTGNTL
jgi:hypothetical protein